MENVPKVHLLFGFLGAGKTTLVRNLLETSNSDIPTAVIVNEFGQVGIDGEILQGKSIDTIELLSGCICCTLKGSLLNAIEELAYEKGAERIIVEATGVADPEDMLDDLEDPSVIDNFDVAPIVTVVDAANFYKIRMVLGEFYVSQILNADIVVLNKIDLAQDKSIKNVTNQLREINPDAEIRFTEFCNVDSSLIFSELKTTQIGKASDHSHERHHHHEHDTMTSFVLQPYSDLSRSALVQFCDKLPDNVWRMKGHMQLDGEPSLVQYSTGQLDISESDPRIHYRMVVIGQKLNAQKVASGLGEPIVVQDT